MRDDQNCPDLVHFIYGKYEWGHFEIKQLNNTQSQYNKIEWKGNFEDLSLKEELL